jgi:hypothetical protein
MIAEVAFLVSLCLILVGSFLLLGRRRRPILQPWRWAVVWLGIAVLTASTSLFGVYLFLTHQAEIGNASLSSRLSTLLPIVRTGFWTSCLALLTCWFATGQSRACFVTASMIIWILWAAQAIGI